ncbi:multicopper oxidase domain-containing protein, partial [Micromonospora sp. ATA32]|nr:multicopper oxidase domain-containing protein [Micromonospora sp. ATA32]
TVAPGATRSYTFTAHRPGTYLYEAGHTALGARQVAMGLVGALVVRAPRLAGDPAGTATQRPFTTTRPCWCSPRWIQPSTPTRPATTCAPTARSIAWSTARRSRRRTWSPPTSTAGCCCATSPRGCSRTR